MFQAFVLLCSIYNPYNCVTMQDTTGPHKDYNSCYNRITEMTELANNNIEYFFPKKYACVKINSSDKKNKLKI